MSKERASFNKYAEITCPIQFSNIVSIMTNSKELIFLKAIQNLVQTFGRSQIYDCRTIIFSAGKHLCKEYLID